MNVTPEQIQRYCLMDDVFMRQCLKDNIPDVELILRIILGRNDFRVVELRVDDPLPNLRGRGVRFDVHAIDNQGRHFNVEIQRSSAGAGIRRARYNSSLLDANILLKGDEPDSLPDTYVIFITEHDTRGLGHPLYIVRRRWDDDGSIAETGDTIIYVNGEYRADDAIGRLMHDLNCPIPEKMNYESLAKTAKRFKHAETEVKAMGLVSEEIWNDGKAKGKAEGKLEGKAEGRLEGKLDAFIANLRSLMVNAKWTAEQAMEMLSIPTEERPKYAKLLAAQPQP